MFTKKIAKFRKYAIILVLFSYFSDLKRGMFMNNNLFIEDWKFPSVLSKSEVYEEFRKFKMGDMTARDRIIEHNLLLIFNEISKRFSCTKYETAELMSAGFVGLIKSVDGFDISRGVSFSTYAIECIDNEILMFMRKEKKHVGNISFETPILLENGLDISTFKIEDIIDSTIKDENVDYVSEYEKREVYRIIREIVYELPELDRIIITRQFGFNNKDELATQLELANELGITQSYVSKVTKRALKKIKEELEMLDILDVVRRDTSKRKKRQIRN